MVFELLNAECVVCLLQLYLIGNYYPIIFCYWFSRLNI